MSTEKDQERPHPNFSDDNETDPIGGDTTDARVFSGIFRKKHLVSEVGELQRATYNVTKYPHLAKPIIFNHKHFSSKHAIGMQPGTRYGTTRDEAELTKTFLDLNCAQPEVHKDKCAKYIEETLNKVAHSDHSDVACIIIVVLTHGEANQLYAYDAAYETCKLWEPFMTKANANPTLAGKPKLFFIQACRGDAIDDSQEIHAVDAKTVSVAVVEEPRLKKIPTCADFFIAHSSFLGYMSVRNEVNGSWFIQTLCQALAKYKRQLDLQGILTIVKHSIAYNKTYKEDKKQIPCTESTLTKMLFLAARQEDSEDSTDSLRSRVATTYGDPVKKEEALFSATSPLQDHFAILAALVCLAVLFVAWLLKSEIQCHCHCNWPDMAGQQTP